MSRTLLVAPVTLVLGILLLSVGVGLYDYRAGMVVGGVSLSGLAFLAAYYVARHEERKNADSRQTPSRRSGN